MRPMILYVMEYFKGSEITGAEVGVNIGNNAIEILRFLPNITKLYLIDSYHVFPEHKEISAKALNEFSGRKEFIYDYSVNAANKIENETLDFCYIDADHGYKAVIDDINAYYPKVKKGGILGGHDYAHKGTDVGRAVNDWSNENNYSVVETEIDWWIYK